MNFKMSKCISQHWPSQDAVTNNSKPSHCKIMKTYFLSYLQTQWRWTCGEWCPVTECPAACHSTAFCLIFIVCVCVCVPPSEDNLRSYPHYPPCLRQALWLYQVCRPPDLQRFPRWYSSQLFLGAGDPNSGSQKCSVSVLPSGSSLPLNFGLLMDTLHIVFLWAMINEQPSASKVCRRVT